jgi:transposase
MIISPGFVGIDVSKSTLDIFDSTLGRGQSIDNSDDAIAAHLADWHRQGSFVLFEATGRYDARLRRALGHHGVPFARVNPSKARNFARAAGFLAKTDAVDARMLAAMAQSLRPRTQTPSSPQHDRLTQLVRRRDQLVAMRAQERTRKKEALAQEEADDIHRHITWLTTEIDNIESRIDRLIASDDHLKRAAKRLTSAPGVGPVTAAILLALMPELGHRSAKSIAALAGLAPINNDSGRFRGKRSIKPGRRRVTTALYMAALAAARSNPRFNAIYEKMINAGKPAKVAIIAIARKLIVALNAMQRDNANYAS